MLASLRPKFRPAGSGGGGGGATLTYTPTDLAQVWGTSTFVGCNIGAVTADRFIIVSIAVDSNAANDLTSVTVGGVAMTLAAKVTNAAGANLFVYYLAAPAGVLNFTTRDIIVSPIGFAGAWEIAVGIITGSAAATFDSSQGSASWHQVNSFDRGVADWSGPLTISSGGVGVFCGLLDRSQTVSSSNTTLDLNINEGGGQNFAFIAGHGTNGSPVFTCNTANINADFLGVSFKP